MIQNTTQLKNIKRGLGVTTQLDWVKNVQEDKDTSSNVITDFPITSAQLICELFTHDNIDLIHRNLSKSFHITIDQLNGFQKIIINNSSHCDVTIEVVNSTNGELYIELNDMSTNQLLTSGLTIIAHENTQFQVATNTLNKKNKLHVAKQLCVLNKNAQVVWFSQSNGTNQTIVDQKANLAGEHSSIKSISYVNGEQGNNFDIATISHHLAPNTKSDIMFKSALEGAKVLSRGLVRIEPVAANSQGYQKSNILLLDKEARAITIPDLEIENKDVMCSHGSTITSIDEAKLFYLKSRGLNEKEAKQLIIKGFIDSVYSELSHNLVIALRKENSKEDEK